MEISRLTSKYQATVPADVRAALGVKAGDQLAWETADDGRVSVHRMKDHGAESKWRGATLIDSQTFSEWLSDEDEELIRDL